jgi:hypothetical protein
MPTFAELAEKYRKIDLMFAFLSALKNNGNEYEFIKTIQDRIYDTGRVNDGAKLITDVGRKEKTYDYAVKTVHGGRDQYGDYYLGKIQKGQKYSNVTLKDTDEFYNSWKLKYSTKFFDLNANFIKFDKKGKMYHIADNFTDMYAGDEEFEEAILSMSKEELNEFLHKIIFDDFMNELKKQL